MGLNYAALSGNCTREPELRTTPSGVSVLQIGLAFNDRRRNPQTQEWEDVPNFIDVIVFNTRAEALSRIITKGMHIAVSGKLRWSQWEKDGQKRSKIELLADEIDIMSPRQGNAPQSAPAPQYAPQNQQRYANPPQPQMAPQMAPQAPTAPAPPQGYGYQQQMPQQPPVQQTLYDEDIPFSAPILPY